MPVIVIACVVAAAWWRHAGGDTTDVSRSASPYAARAELVARTWNGMRLRTPPHWVVLDRDDQHVTWGSPDRRHTVTLAATESSLLPLPGVVRAVVEDAPRALRGAQAVGRATELPVGKRAPRRDTAMLARFVVRDVAAGAGPLELVQVWRRDSRADLDLVATWTSVDGRWPAEPRRSVPEPAVR